MPHRPYIHLAGNLSGWPIGFTPQPAHLRALDQYSSELVDGTLGGSWDPEEPIVIGPCGTPTVTLSTAGSVLSGDIETTEDNENGTELDTPGLILQGGAVPTFQTTRTRTIVVPLTNAVVSKDFTTASSMDDAVAIDPVTLTSLALYVPDSTNTILVPLPIRAQHRGATITSVDFRVRILGTWVALPSAMMFRVVKVTGATMAFLHSAAGGYDANGWYSDTAATVAAFTNNGQVRTLSYVSNQNHTNLNPATSWYFVQMQRLPGTGQLNAISATVNLTAIADYHQE